MDFYTPVSSYGSGHYTPNFGASAPQGQYYSQNTYNAPAASGYGEAPTQMDPHCEFEDEVPLLEELGINFDHIQKKTLAILVPFRNVNDDILKDCDMTGPLCFCLLFGLCLVLSGKFDGFGSIYGMSLVGSLFMYALTNLMSINYCSLASVVSIMGYSLLPMTFIAASSIFFNLRNVPGIVFCSLLVLWSSASASALFSSLLHFHHRVLLMYPSTVLYGLLALLTFFNY